MEGKIAEGFNPTLAFVFVSIQFDLEAVQAVFDQKNIQVFGTTTEGEICGSVIGKQSASIMLFDLNQDYFRIFIKDFGDKGYLEASKSIAKKTQKYFKRSAFLLSGSGVWNDLYIEAISDGFKDVCGQDVVLFGGNGRERYDVHPFICF